MIIMLKIEKGSIICGNAGGLGVRLSIDGTDVTEQVRNGAAVALRTIGNLSRFARRHFGQGAQPILRRPPAPTPPPPKDGSDG